MPVIKSEFPILEFDDSEKAVLEPNHERLNLQLPERLVFPFLREHADEFALSLGGEIVAEFETVTRIFPVYRAVYHDIPVTVCRAPLGGAAAAEFLDWLIAYGVRKIVSAGSCGTLSPQPENAFRIPVRALRDEGAGYHYLAPSRFVETDRGANEAIKSAMRSSGIPFEEVTTWTTDGIYRETPDMIRYRAEEGCSVVEMECSAMACVAKRRGAQFGQILFTADSLASLEEHDARDWGKDSYEKALRLCLEAVIRM